MEQSYFQDPSWYHAITLTERIAALRPVQPPRPKLKVNRDLAERRMHRWRSQLPFTRGSLFAQRLASDGISENDLRCILGEAIDAVRDRVLTPPEWLAELAEALSGSLSSRPSILKALRGENRAGLLDTVEPLISQGCERLHQGIQALSRKSSDLPFDPGTVARVLFATLAGRLVEMLGRTMVLELNVTRLQGLLPGDTPEQRFRSFIERMCQPETALALLKEYPVLARQLTIRIHNWATFGLEFLQHLCGDWDTLRKAFSPDQAPGLLIQVDGDVGDSHRNGRSVLIAKFSSGLKMLYKPRSMALDAHFQELLSWVNERGDHPPFRMLQILDRRTYGWVEFVDNESCASSEEVRRFYERQGGYLALLYALEGTDFHCENLVAAGEHPVLVDLEALFHPRTKGIDIRPPYQLVSKAITDSVLRIGLLPQRIWSNAESEGIDLSGLGAEAGQVTPYGVPQWEGAGTDGMRLIRKPVAIAGDQNRPTLNGAEVDVLNYSEAIAAGFTKIYQLLVKHREELLSDDGPLERFAEDEVRVILRPTQTYASLLRESFHPDVLHDALDRGQLFDRLWVGAEYRPHLVRVIPAEVEDLHKGDIPLFTTCPESQHLWSSSNARIADFFEEEGLALAQRRVQRLNEDDLGQQLWFIRASLTSLATAEDRGRWPTYPVLEPKILADRQRFVKAAQAVGNRLETLALRGEGQVAWIGVDVINNRHLSLVPLWLDLYDGLPGLALFLAYLGTISHEDRYTALATTVLTTLRYEIESGESRLIGAFNGWGGVIYMFTHLGVLWDEPALLAEAQELVDRLPALIDRDKRLDIISGAAGCIGSLLSLYRCAPSEGTLAAAIQCGDHLIARAQPMEQGIGWSPKFGGTKPLAGFSHGAAGIAWALLELAALTGEERFRTAALAAIAYERSLFLPEVGNWPDLREFATKHEADNSNQPACMTAWCHGAPGIGVARLRTLQYLDDTEIRSEIEAALKTTLTQGFGHNHSLCHGDLGNLELLLLASEILDEPKWSAQVSRIAAMILESIDRHGWLCGIPLGVESPGLMTGIAGIGYELLRLAEPTRVPSVLVLEAPKRCS